MEYKIAFFGDDFTGSTDALETLEEMGLSTILFTDLPTVEQLEAFGEKQAIGVAGMTRTLSVAEIEKQLEEVFDRFSKINLAHFHYKVCSTFDSSPEVGSIGKAIDVGAKAFSSTLVPLLVGAPYLGRYCAFGNLFARMGTGKEGEVFRLDRHPSMSKHPVTPADESDLRRHLAQQTEKEIELIDITQLEQSATDIIAQLANETNEATKVVLFDTLHEQHLERIGEVLEKLARHNKPLFSVGSSAVSKALCAAWKKEGWSSLRKEWPISKPTQPLLVLSGSCALVTGRQISYALEKGFAEVAIDSVALAVQADNYAIQPLVEQILSHMHEGKDVLVHTSIGPDDPRIEEVRRVLRKDGHAAVAVNAYTATLYGKVLAQIADEVAQSFPIERLVVAGGDTSSLFARQMGIEAVEMIAPVVPGAPLCKIHARKKHIHGITINFKGGQVGEVDYLVRLSRTVQDSHTPRN